MALVDETLAVVCPTRIPRHLYQDGGRGVLGEAIEEAQGVAKPDYHVSRVRRGLSSQFGRCSDG
jgi:hypothetical protein